MITAIIQARMTSTRLPRKVLREVLGKPLIAYLIERLRASQHVQQIVVATTTNDEDDTLSQFAETKSLLVYRGSEHDVLDRYYQAARRYNAETIMRVTADCPLLDPHVCDRIAQTYCDSGVDIVRTGPTFCEGLDCEVFSFAALERAWHDARLPSEREHVTLYMYNHPEFFRKVIVENTSDDGQYRLTVDHEEDFEVVQAIIRECIPRSGNGIISLYTIKEFLDSHPHIAGKNRRMIRNEGLLTSRRNDMESYFDRLWPICRSIAGPGFLESLDILEEIMPMERRSFPTGQHIFDWTIPREWHVRDAYLVDPQGKKRAEFRHNNLHLLGYSIPFRGTLSLDALRPHLYSLPEQPAAIPYLTSYYQDRWGFCFTHNELQSLPPGDYQVVVDTELRDGSLVIGEAVLPGETEEEVLFSTYLCHPSMANNELSGPLVAAFLYQQLAALPQRRLTYRFVVVPETIGALAYLSVRGEHLKRRLIAGFVLTCIGDAGPFTYKLSRHGSAVSDRIARVVLRDHGAHTILPFRPDGSDERQYCSPGFDLPVGSLMRTPWGRYPEYHTSLDNKAFISFDALMESVEILQRIVRAIEANYVWRGTVQHGEPQLSKRGLYPTLGSQKDTEFKVSTMMWLLNLADGTRDLLTIAEESRMSMASLMIYAQQLSKAGLLDRVDS